MIYGMTHGAWTGNDEKHNRISHQRWLQNLARETGTPGYLERWYDAQCGGCHFWIALRGQIGDDWGACTNPVSAFDARIRFEHDGCDAYTTRIDGSFG